MSNLCKFYFLGVLCLVSALGNNLVLMEQQGYEYIEKDSCFNREYQAELKHNIDLTKCRPLDTIINLKPKRADIRLNLPTSMIVKRCGNCGCPGNTTCLPVPESKKIVQRAVQHILFNGSKECGFVNLEEHERCKCACQLSEESCNSNQIFLPRECVCRCIDKISKHICLIENNIWNEHDCSCSCSDTNRFCSTGSVWVPSMCRCVRLKALDMN